MGVLASPTVTVYCMAVAEPGAINWNPESMPPVERFAQGVANEDWVTEWLPATLWQTPR
jgi:hypothetical protein